MEDNKYISVGDFAKKVGLSDVYIRGLCRDKKLNYIEAPAKHTKKMSYYVDLEGAKTEIFLRERNLSIDIFSRDIDNNSDIKEGNIDTSDDMGFGVNGRGVDSTIDSASDSVVNILNRYEGYIAKAAKFDMLEDKSNSQADTIQYLQGELSKLGQEITTLEKTVSTLETEKKYSEKEIENLKNQLEVEKNRPFWRKPVM